MINIMSYTTQNSLLLEGLTKFYNKDNNINKILSIINGQSDISLRLIDWFVTNFSKKYYTYYDITELGDKRRFKVYIDYKLKLKAYSKKRFDPFCRWDRITIPYGEGTSIQTTIGQLNFFRWILENNVINYIKENLKDIETDMNNRNNSKTNRQNGDGKTRRKRQELSMSATKSIKKEIVEVVVTFD